MESVLTQRIPKYIYDIIARRTLQTFSDVTENVAKHACNTIKFIKIGRNILKNIEKVQINLIDVD